MILSIYDIDTELDIISDKINILEIHNSNLLFNIIYSIIDSQTNKPAEKIEFITSEKNLNIEKDVFIINDIFNIDINNRKIINKLYLEIKDYYDIEIDKYDKLSLAYSNLISNLITGLLDIDLCLEYNNEIDIPIILKSINLTFDNNFYYSPKDKIIAFLEIVSRYKLFELIIFVNLKAFFSENILLEIYEIIKKVEVNVLLIENQKRAKKLYENKLIIDMDYFDYIG